MITIGNAHAAKTCTSKEKLDGCFEMSVKDWSYIIAGDAWIYKENIIKHPVLVLFEKIITGSNWFSDNYRDKNSEKKICQ